MKKMMTALVALFAFVASANAMGYEQARQQALFLTDKMAYELNLTEEQYEAAYEINLDYLMGVNTPDDLYGLYWDRRNLDLSYILFDWQYRLYLDAAYFYRPLYWNAGYWHFSIYARYPHRNYFYFGRPHFYNVYRGAHSWHRNGGRSWYHGRSYAPKSRKRYIGMYDRFQSGHYGHGNRNMKGGGPTRGGKPHVQPNRPNTRPHDNGPVAPRKRNEMQRRDIMQNSNGNFGGARKSSTRTTVGSQLRTDPAPKSFSTTPKTPRTTFTPQRSTSMRPSAAESQSVSKPSRMSSGNRNSVGMSPRVSSGTRSSVSSHSSNGGSRNSGGSHRANGGSRSSGGGHNSGGFGGRR